MAPLLGYVVLVLLHGALGSQMRLPRIYADELGYIGHARYLSGAGTFPEMGTTSFYHFGYSLWLVPVVWLFPDPAVGYKAIVVANGFLISLLFPALYYVLHSGLGVSRNQSLAVTFVTSLYPAFMHQSNFAWAEVALIPAYVVLIAAFVGLLKHESHASAVCVGVLAAYLYTIHPRALPVLPVVALFLSALSAAKLVPWRLTATSIACLVVTFLATDLLNDHLRSVGWSPAHEPISATGFLTRAASQWKGALLATAGQLLYLTQATFGLFLIGPLYAAFMVRTHGIRDTLETCNRPRALLIAFVVVTSAGLFFASVMAMASGARRADHFIYGRYNEPFLPLYIAFGLLVLGSAWYRTTRTSLPYWALAMLAGLTIVMQFAVAEKLARNYVPPNVFGILALAKALGRIDIVVISIVSMLVCAAVAASSKRSRASGIVVVAAGFGLGTGYAYASYVLPPTKGPLIADTLPSRIRQLRVTVAGYDMSGRPRPTPGRFYTYQYLLPGAALKKFNSDRGHMPPSPVVIAKKQWPHGERLGAKLVAEEPITDHALWVLSTATDLVPAPRSYVGIDLGWRPYTGVWESGFHFIERRRGHRPVRWTGGRARLVVPVDVNQPPAKLAVHLVRSPRATRVVVNGVELLSGPPPAHRRVVSLAAAPVNDRLTIELITEPPAPNKQTSRSRDARKLGVGVRSIRLLPQ